MKDDIQSLWWSYHLKICGFCDKKEAVSFLKITACCYYDESVLKRKRAHKDVFKEFVHVHPPIVQQPWSQLWGGRRTLRPQSEILWQHCQRSDQCVAQHLWEVMQGLWAYTKRTADDSATVGFQSTYGSYLWTWFLSYMYMLQAESRLGESSQSNHCFSRLSMQCSECTCKLGCSN